MLKTFKNYFWLVVWNIFLFFHSVRNNHPNWLSYFFRGVAQPPTRFLHGISITPLEDFRTSPWRPLKCHVFLQHVFLVEMSVKRGKMYYVATHQYYFNSSSKTVLHHFRWASIKYRKIYQSTCSVDSVECRFWDFNRGYTISGWWFGTFGLFFQFRWE